MLSQDYPHKFYERTDSGAGSILTDYFKVWKVIRLFPRALGDEVVQNAGLNRLKTIKPPRFLNNKKSETLFQTADYLEIEEVSR